MVIIGKRTGQLGNRLFVFAHIIANAIEYNYEVHNPSFYGYTQYFTGTMNDFFCRYPSRSSRLHGTALQGFYYRLISKGVLPLAKLSAISKLANIKTLDIDPATYPEDCYDMTNPDYIELATSGTLFINDPWLFRDYVNFNKHADRIRTYFTPVEKHSSVVSSLISHARSGCELLVGVHIRQGDYKRWQNGKYYFTTSEYAAIMERFAASMPDKRITFLICSNEKQDEAAFKNLNHVMGSNDALEDMYAFAQCDLLIGPPSTYTAWASFYGSAPLFALDTATDHIAIDGFHISNG